MADLAPITVAFYGFGEEQKAIVLSAFEHAAQWNTPWLVKESIYEAHVVIVEFSSDDDYDKINDLKKTLPNAEIVIFSAKKPPKTKSEWHMQRQPNGKVAIVSFSQVVLKISQIVKKKISEPTNASYQESDVLSANAKTNRTLESIINSTADNVDMVVKPDDVVPFFDKLDSLLDTKPNRKRKRFNDS